MAGSGSNNRLDKKQKNFFDPVDPEVNFTSIEKELLEKWYRKGVVDKYLRRNKSSKKTFSFLDGPITANNPMGVHHAWGRTYKDLWQRYKNMQGFRERFQNGFDCQGLWVEVEVEKELGLKSKKDIESLVPGDKKASIAKFVELCKERVYRFSKVQTEQSKRLGYFMDWEHSYYTLSDENNYMIWYFLKKCHEMGLIYKGRDSVPWCPRCGTAISQHEMLTEDYKEVKHDSVYVKYPVVGKKDHYLLVWTTTPWTLPGNVAVAVDEDRDYVLASEDGREFYYLSEFAARQISLKIVKRLKGEEIVGLNYQSPFDDLPRVIESLANFRHQVVKTDPMILPISEEEGTGLVHVAPGAGTEDFHLGEKLGLPVIELIDDQATYIPGLGDFSGKNAKDHPEIILSFLKDNPRFLFSIVPYTHRYPACWRCKTELVWRVVDEWYIAMDPLREPLKKVARRINWIPKFGLKRELDWLSNMHDWLISKKRYWGLALPIWECKNCGNFEVLGSKEELKKRAVQGWEKFEGHSPHRPFIDEVKLECKECKSIVERIPDVGNPWLDAGIVSFSTITADNKGEPLYFKDRKEFENWYPADFVTESFPGQFKNWFYSLITMSTVLEGREPCKTILGFATLLGEDGRPMHKSWGNAIEFNEGAEKIGVDVMRWMYARQDPSQNLLFGYKVADEVRRRFHLKLWNIYNFFVSYANAIGWKPKSSLEFKAPKSEYVLDRWILLRLKETLDGVTQDLDNYNACTAAFRLEEFVEDLSNWYLRLSRERAATSIKHSKTTNLFYETMYFILVNLSKILAPFVPYISDYIYTNLTKVVSVHLVDWPAIDFREDKKLLEEMTQVRKIAEKIHSVRKKKTIPVRQPLASVTVNTPEPKPGDQLLELLGKEVNIKKVIWKKGSKLSVKLDTKITPELSEEFMTRDLIRKIQEERKKLGVSLTDKIVVYNEWYPESKELYNWVKSKTLAKELKVGKFKVAKDE